MEPLGFSVENAVEALTEDVAGVLYFDALIDGNLAAPSAATVTIVQPGGSAMPDTAVSGAAATVSGARVSYSLSAEQLANSGRKYRATWTVTISEVDYPFVQYFDVTYRQVPVLISDRDLFAESPKLNYEDQQYSFRGTATGGDTSTIVDANELKGFFANDIFNGCVVRILDGTNARQIRRVTDYVDSTGTLTLSPVFGSAIDTTSIYCIFTYALAIKRAADQLAMDLRNKGMHYRQIADLEQLRELQIMYACRLIFQGKVKAEGDEYDVQRKIYDDRIVNSLKTIVIDYDNLDDGLIDDIDDQDIAVSTQIKWSL